MDAFSWPQAKYSGSPAPLLEQKTKSFPHPSSLYSHPLLHPSLTHHPFILIPLHPSSSPSYLSKHWASVICLSIRLYLLVWQFISVYSSSSFLNKWLKWSWLWAWSVLVKSKNEGMVSTVYSQCIYASLTGPLQQVLLHTTGSGCWLGGRKPLLVWLWPSHHRGVQTKRVVPNSPGQHWPGPAIGHSCGCSLWVRALWWHHEPYLNLSTILWNIMHTRRLNYI